MFASGLIIFCGCCFIFIKLPPRIQLRILGYPVLLDLFISGLTLFLHWGTFTGVMAASFAGLLTSLASSVARRFIGYIRQNKYYPGLFRLKV